MKKTERVAALILCAVLMFQVMPASAAVSESFETGKYSEKSWELNSVSGAVDAGIVKGNAALTIRTGNSKPTAATAVKLRTDYGGHGKPMYFEYDFSFTNETGFQIRGSNWEHAFSVESNKFYCSGNNKGTFDYVCDILPDVIHTLRLECYTEAAVTTPKVIAYLDGTKVTEYAKSESPTEIGFLVATANAEAKLYRVARMVAHDNPVRNYCETFDGETIATLKERGVTQTNAIAGKDGWEILNNGHTVTIETDNDNTGYLKLNRTHQSSGNGSLIYTVPADEPQYGNLNVNFLYYGAGQTELRFHDASGDNWLCKMFLQDGKLYWGNSVTDYTGDEISGFISPFTKHKLTLSLTKGNVTVFLDNKLLCSKAPFSSGFAALAGGKLRFYTIARSINTDAWGEANRFLYTGFSIESITTDTKQLDADLQIGESDGKITAWASVVNYGDTPQQARVLLAKYIGKELIAVELGDEITVKGKTGLTTEAVCFDKSDGALYKAMLFDSLKEIRPLAKFKVR